VTECQLSETLFDRNFRWLKVYGLKISGPRFEPATKVAEAMNNGLSRDYSHPVAEQNLVELSS